MDEYYEVDSLRRRAARDVLRDDADVRRAQSYLFWTVFKACFLAMCAWTVLDMVAKVAVAWWVGRA